MCCSRAPKLAEYCEALLSLAVFTACSMVLLSVQRCSEMQPCTDAVNRSRDYATTASPCADGATGASRPQRVHRGSELQSARTFRATLQKVASIMRDETIGSQHASTCASQPGLHISKACRISFVSVSPTALSEANFRARLCLPGLSHIPYPVQPEACRALGMRHGSYVHLAVRGSGPRPVAHQQLQGWFTTRQTSGPVGSCHDFRGSGKRYYPIIAPHPGAYGSQGDLRSGGGDIIQSYFKTPDEAPPGILMLASFQHDAWHCRYEVTAMSYRSF